MNANIIDGIIAEAQPFLALGERLSFIYNNILSSINEQSSKSTAMILETYQKVDFSKGSSINSSINKF
ncbi:unnamed protein product [Rotaria magnacalcarata]|uniref:Uncharacterized protein n=1 Tax=Rotaria magnacalcarata TaxID=392030 RepID=A0A8S3FQ37_9BILA|nr:unnamed protein product [Rotaria magnacalcarata]